MAIYYVDSEVVGGDNGGSTWANAALSLAIDWGATINPATDIVYVDDGHQESAAAVKTITGSTAEGTTDPVVILCVDKADDSLSTGAKVTTTGNNNILIDEKIRIYGVDFFAGNNLILADNGTDHDIYIENGRLELTTSSGADEIVIGNASSSGQKVHLVNTDVDFAHAAQGFNLKNGALIWDGGTLGLNVTNLLEVNGVEVASVEIVNVDLSICSNNLVLSSGFNLHSKVLFSRCKLHADVTLVNGTIDVPGQIVQAHLCDDGTDADPAVNLNTIPLLQTYNGQVFLDTARYRTGGASDGVRTNPYSYSMDAASASSNVIELYDALESPEIAAWTDGDGSTPHTYRIYLAAGAVLQDDEIWMVLTGPNDVATDSLGLKPGKDGTHSLGTRLDPRGSPANVTQTGLSDWVGADRGEEQYVELTYTPDKPGPITARVYLAISDRVSVDPKIYIDP